MSDLADPEVSIILVSFNQSEKTVNCLKSIRANDPMAKEIIWVDNGSNADEFTIIRRAATRPRMRTKLIRFNRNTGFVHAVNSALKEIDKRSKYVLLLNNDCEIGWNTCGKLIAPLIADKKVGASGPITQSRISWQEPSNLNRRWKTLGMPLYSNNLEKYTSSLEKKFSGQVIDVGNLNLAFFCTAFRKEVFVDELQGLEAEFNIGLGEDDFACHKLRYLGYKLVLALDAFVFHHHRTTFNANHLCVDSIRRANMVVLRRKVKELKKEKNVEKEDTLLHPGICPT